MSLDIQPTVAKSVSSSDSRLESALNQRGNLSILEAKSAESKFMAEASSSKQKVFRSVSQYQQQGGEEKMMRGQQLVNSGNAKKAMGGALMGTGFVMIATGLVFLATGLGAAAGASMLAAGMASVGQGVGQMIMGGTDVANGQGEMMRAQEMLDKATENEVLSKQEAKVIRKEMNRSKILEFKKEALKELIDTIRPQLEELGINTEEMDEKELQKWFDKMFEKGAETLANGGMLETNLDDADGNPLFFNNDGEKVEGTFYFFKDEESGDYFQVEPAMDDDGNIMTGALGEPLLLDGSAKKVDDGDLKAYLDLQFQFVDLAKTLSRQLGTTDVNDSGEETYTPYDPDNIAHMQEFSDLVKKSNFEAIESGQVEGPVKVIHEDGNIFLQKWDWVNDIPIGIKVPFAEITGGTLENGGAVTRSNDQLGSIEAYQGSIERSQAALEELGLGVGSKSFNLLAGQNNFELRAPLQGVGDLGFGNMSGRNSDAFQQFQGLGAAVAQSRETSILDSQQSDETNNGNA